MTENEAAAVATETSRASRDWTPIDNYNEKFIHLVKKREEEAESLLYDHEKTNKVSLVMQFQYLVTSGLFVFDLSHRSVYYVIFLDRQ